MNSKEVENFIENKCNGQCIWRCIDCCQQKPDTDIMECLNCGKKVEVEGTFDDEYS